MMIKINQDHPYHHDSLTCLTCLTSGKITVWILVLRFFGFVASVLGGCFVFLSSVSSGFWGFGGFGALVLWCFGVLGLLNLPTFRRCAWCTHCSTLFRRFPPQRCASG
ncbi:hypothetical protein BZA77DRAFT_298914 [Pyronema omphalodes]|nr:hypothetical protein BZA77DRAFT_298914 [Pyronema omphalodes]